MILLYTVYAFKNFVKFCFLKIWTIQTSAKAGRAKAGNRDRGRRFLGEDGKFTM